MIYRKAGVNDAQELAELRKKQLIDEGEQAENDIDDEMKRYFSVSIDSGELICWVAEEGETIIATSAICFYCLPPTFSNPTGQNAYITNMYTKNEFRRAGIATKLLTLLINEAVEQNYKVIRLHASEMGKSIYLEAGFEDSSGFMSKRL
ncbi:MAG: GNAT family N-acetyltransferase [Clostridia bacterium]|jgi:ribosomal protein S18 acetylase RimI-like enzyme|nr:GNAT family N-acetyltransferase [Clostridia bacterium]MBT7122901.1 GNAT family N-acetyltransferase [Clostridia bacterium]